jgi:hypothetical protein
MPISKWTGFAVFVAIVGFAGLIDPCVAYGQIEGAVQYPPRSIGEDAQPPPPAGMVSPITSPRKLEFGASGSSRPPVDPPYWVRPNTVRLPIRPAPLSGASPVPPPTGSGAN